VCPRHEPQVYCPAQGKAHKPQEFGSKASVVMTATHGVNAAAVAHAQNEPDGPQRIIVRGDHVAHWLNGVRVLTYDLGSPALAAAKAQSKFSKEAKWGTKFATPILLQDHGDEIWFRNVKLRPLP
jgi:Domain of Unknown Function (DUF1080)